MSTRYQKTSKPNEIPGGYEGDNVPEDFEIPSCSLEDVDKALFDLFNEEMPLYYKFKKTSRRIPVIFATGERFAILRRRRPLRDKAGSLILPLVSVMRTGVEQQPSLGTSGGQNAPMIIKKRLSQDDSRFQAVVNKLGLNNQDNLASSGHVAGESLSGKRATAEPGTFAVRNGANVPSRELQSGKVLSPNLGMNVYEIIQMPPVKYFQATYDVTFWAQYMQQMNDMLTATMISPQNYPGRCFRIESKKGYWFSAFVDTALNSGVNFDDFSDDERIIRYNFTINVVGYVIAPEFPGAKVPLRRFLSAPNLSFDTSQISLPMVTAAPGNVKSGDPSDYVLSDIMTDGSPVPSQAMGTSQAANIAAMAGELLPGSSAMASQVAQSVAIGGFEKTSSTGAQPLLLKVFKDPFTGKLKREMLKISPGNRKKGETVFKNLDSQGVRSTETFVLDLGALIET